MEGATSPKEKKKKKNTASMAGAGASQYLANLPSRGLFSSTVLSSNLGGVRVYICEHETSPPAEQVIKTNQTNILIRSLTLKKQKNDCSSKAVKVKAATKAPKGKRSAEKTADGNSAKKANMTISSGSLQQEGSSSPASEEFQGLTVERLRALLKHRGLVTKGKKDELIARLKDNHKLIIRMRNGHKDDAEESIL